MTDTRPAKIVLSTFGSFGDIHPYMAIALELQRRGHRATIATSGVYRNKIESEGIGFAAIRPDITDFGDIPEFAKHIMDFRTGGEFVIRKIIMPNIRAMFDDLSAAASGADLLVSHTLTVAAPLVVELQGMKWASTVLAPFALLSIYDPPVLAPAPGLTRLRGMGPRVFGPLMKLVKHRIRAWTEPVQQLRSEVGLARSQYDPMFEGQYAPDLNLALFSTVIGAPQPDWPINTVPTGFPVYDRLHSSAGLSPELSAFLDAGPAPIVFTLGSAAVMDAGTFYEESALAALQLGLRAILLIGSDPRNRPAAPLPASIGVFEYAPYSELFPRAAAVVHQGGIGTTAQALWAGRPMLVMPYSHDQPDNAERVSRLGVALSIRRCDYDAAAAARALSRLISEPQFRETAASVRERLLNEDGARTACDAIEELLAN